jgi:hypothetical protein
MGISSKAASPNVGLAVRDLRVDYFHSGMERMYASI